MVNSIKREMSTLFKSEILLIGISFAKTLAQLPKDIFIIIRMFIIALSVIARNWKQPKCLVIYNEIQAITRNEIHHMHAHINSHIRL